LKDHLRVAIQVLSGQVPRHVVYGHLGWRHLDGRWIYLHAGGALCSEGQVDGIEVEPPAALDRYVLPAPPTRAELAAAIRATLGFLELAPDTVTVPLLAAAFRAPLCQIAMPGESIHLAGPTGSGKTTLAALVAAMWGPDPAPRHLAASWHSTGNALERLAHAAADVVLVVDDYAPQGGRDDVTRMGREAERFLRAAGNRQGRHRMAADSSLRPTYSPRGLIISTGEDIPRGQSLRARLVVLELSNGDIDWSAVTVAQGVAREGSYARAMAGYLVYLAGRLDELRAVAPARLAALRDAAMREGMHRRTPDAIASLAWGIEVYLAFAVEVGALGAAEAKALQERVWAALGEVAMAQAQHVAAGDPVDRWWALLAGALTSGRAHVEDARNGGDPFPDPERWGWQRVSVRGIGGVEEQVLRPSGRRIGWVESGPTGMELLLDPEAAFAEVQIVARDQGDHLPVSARTLWKRLHERGHLLSRDDSHLTVLCRGLGGVHGRRRVLHLRASPLAPSGTSGAGDEMSGEVSMMGDTTPSEGAAASGAACGAAQLLPFGVAPVPAPLPEPSGAAWTTAQPSGEGPDCGSAPLVPVWDERNEPTHVDDDQTFDPDQDDEVLV